MVRDTDWADIGPPERAFADERDCGVVGIERDICTIDMVFYARCKL